MPDTIWSFDIEMFDIELPETGEGQGDMDALTSLELEAQRRRETVASDRDIGLARAMASTETVEPTSVRRAVVAALAARPAADTDCQPAPLTRQGAG